MRITSFSRLTEIDFEIAEGEFSLSDSNLIGCLHFSNQHNSNNESENGGNFCKRCENEARG